MLKQRGVVGWLQNLLALIVLPTSFYALSVWLGASDTTAQFVWLTLFVLLLAYFLSGNIRRRISRQGGGMSAVVIGAVAATLLIPSSSSAVSELDIEFGGFNVGPVVAAKLYRPWAYGDEPPPPAGCRQVHGWSTGRAPAGAYVAYRFHLRVTWCWSYQSMIGHAGPSQQVDGWHFSKQPRIRAWWTDERGVKHDSVQFTTRRFACQIGAQVYSKECLYVLAVGQVSHPAIPVVGIGEITAHPWVKIVVYANGKWKELNHDRSPI